MLSLLDTLSFTPMTAEAYVRSCGGAVVPIPNILYPYKNNRLCSKFILEVIGTVFKMIFFVASGVNLKRGYVDVKHIHLCCMLLSQQRKTFNNLCKLDYYDGRIGL